MQARAELSAARPRESFGEANFSFARMLVRSWTSPAAAPASPTGGGGPTKARPATRAFTADGQPRYMASTSRPRRNLDLLEAEVEPSAPSPEEEARTARLLARTRAQRVAQTARPMATSTPKAAGWRRWPGGAERREADDVWQTVSAEHESRRLGRPASAQRQASPAGHGKPSPAGHGSQRALSPKQRGYQLQRQLELRERRVEQSRREQAREDEAKAELLQTARRIALLRKKPAGGPINPTERKKVQARLYKASTRPRSGRVYGSPRVRYESAAPAVAARL